MKYIYLALLLIFTGCTPHISVNVIKSPTFSTKNKTIAISYFKNDYINLSPKIENKLHTLNMRRGHADLKIDGVIMEPTVSSYTYRDIQNKVFLVPVIENGIKTYTEVVRPVEIMCLVKTYSVSSIINIVENENIVFSKQITKSSNIDFCRDRLNYNNPYSYNQYNNTNYDNSYNRIDFDSMSNEIANEFSEYLVEKNYYKNIYFMNELENNIKTTNMQIKESIFKSAIDNLKNANYAEATKYLDQINDHAATYNLGLIEESKGNYNKALEFYSKAGNSATVIEGLNRVKETIISINNR